MTDTPMDTAAKRRELLDRRLAAHGLDAPAPAAAKTAVPDPAVPDPAVPDPVLSPAQERVWFAQQTLPDSPLYNLGVAFDLRGPLHHRRLTEAFDLLERRHAELRTIHPAAADGTPTTVVRDPGGGLLRIVYPDGADQGDPDGEPGALIDSVVAAPFDLAVDRPLRALLIVLGPAWHVLVVVVHHIAWDDASWLVLHRELSAIYAGGATAAASLPVPGSLADHVSAEHVALRTPVAADHLAWWTSHLTPAPAEAVPGAAGGRAAVPGGPAETCRAALPPSAVSGVLDLGRREGATTFVTVLALYAVLVHRTTGETDLAVSVPVSLRDGDDEPSAPVIGNLANTVVVRIDLGGDPGFVDVVRRVRDAVLEAHERRRVPIDRVVAAVRPDPRRGLVALSPTMFSARSRAAHELRLDGVEVRERAVDPPAARFDLAVEIVPADDGGLSVRATAPRGHLADGVLDGIGRRLIALARGAACPDTPIAALPLLDAEEYLRVVREWNRTERPDLDRGGVLSTMVVAAADRHPEATAVVDGERRWSYRELTSAVGTLAARLTGLGAGPGALVGVHLDRSVEQVVAILGTLAAGAAFVPLEPQWPDGRLAEVITGTAPAAILSATVPPVTTGSTCFGDVPVLHPLDDRGEGPPPAPTVDTEDLAYVIHTSGSTGTPKGVMIRHRSICHRLRWQLELLDLGAADAVLYKAPMGFDIAVNELLLPLVAGARLVIAGPGEERDVDRLLDLVVRERVSFAYLTSSLLGALLDRPGIEAAAGVLRHVWCGGEVLTPALFGRFRAVLGDAVMYHGYGPAEATIGVTCEVYRGEAARDAVTIGRPNPNTRIHVLDRNRRPLPPGMRGELYVGGVPLARGYLGDPERTSARFVPDPFSADFPADFPGADDPRLYATGDVGRLRPDGVIEFLGRDDRQVKVRGRRVELGEVESVLGRHPAVHEAVVMALDGPGGTELAAVVATGTTVAAALPGWLRERLPDHAVPRVLHELTTLPRRPSGKVDLDALRDDLTARSAAAADHSADPPGTPTETAVAEVWGRYLGRAGVGAGDAFFDLGGSSLLLPRVVAALGDRLGVEVRILDVFTHPTVRELAAALDGRSAPAPATPDRGGTRPTARAASARAVFAGRSARPRRNEQ